jgi:histidinol phosphatase-like enzyme
MHRHATQPVALRDYRLDISGSIHVGDKNIDFDHQKHDGVGADPMGIS